MSEKKPKQLSMFPAKPYMSDASRWPRGYTPERQAAVESALSSTQFGDKDSRWAVPGARDAREEAAVQMDTIKRSSIPVKHLRGLRSVSYNNMQPAEAAGSYQFRTNAMPSKPEARVSLYTPVKQVEGGDYLSPRSYMERGLIHELGHHYNNLTFLDRKSKNPEYTLPSSRVFPTMPSQVKEEARAENYADEHYVADRRTPKEKTVTGYDERFLDAEREHHYFGKSGDERFRKPYAAVRNLSAPQFQQLGHEEHPNVITKKKPISTQTEMF
jgi:hypothetical protein